MSGLAGVPRRRAMGQAAYRLAGSVRAFIEARSGSSAVEVSIIAGLVSTAIVASLGLIAEPLGKIVFGI